MENNLTEWLRERTEFWHRFYQSKIPNLPTFQIKIYISNKLRTTAGIAYTYRKIIKYSYHLAKMEGAAFDKTIAHEVAHLVADSLYGIGQKHNDNWRRIFAMSGYPVARCHQYQSVKRNVKTRIRFWCHSCNNSMLTTKNSMTKVLKTPTRFYKCKCGNVLDYNNLPTCKKEFIKL